MYPITLLEAAALAVCLTLASPVPTSAELPPQAARTRVTAFASDSWVKRLDGTFDLVSEPASLYPIEVYKWVERWSVEKGTLRLVREWQHVVTLRPGQTSTHTFCGDVRFVVRGQNHLAASEHPWGLSACWGSRIGEPARAWIRVVKRG